MERMHQCAEICLPRKKRVPDTFHSNTYRIFNESAPERLASCKVYTDHTYPRRSAEERSLNQTHNVPQPHNVRFIRTNVRWLNAPISHVETEGATDNQGHWWPNGYEQSVKRPAPYGLDSVQRRDYQTAPHRYVPSTRAGSNPNTSAATGIVPTLNPTGHRTDLVEHMSFIHQYDSRKLRDQPYQGKRHGVFVWREMEPAGGPRGTGTFRSREEGLPRASGSAVTSPQPARRSPRDDDGGGAIATETGPAGSRTAPRALAGPRFEPGASPKRTGPGSSSLASAPGASGHPDRVRSSDTSHVALPSIRRAGRLSLP